MYSNLNSRYIFGILGKILLFESIFMLTCVVWSLLSDDSTTLPLSVSAGIVFFASLIFHLFSIGKKSDDIGAREAYIILVSSWLLLCVFGVLPYVLTGVTKNITDAFFESVSGFSTTGATIFHDVETLPRSILWWRGLTHWMGGMGILLLVMAIIPYLNVTGLSFFTADASGLETEKLNPSINKTARRLWGIYLSLTIGQALLLWLGNVSVFESIVMSFSTISTGAFSVKNDSVASYSVYSQYVIASFMMVSGVNFVLIYHLLKRNLTRISNNEELRTYAVIAMLSILLIGSALWFASNFDIETSFRYAYFQTASFLSTTGLTNTNYMLWQHSAWVVLFALMFIGASSGSPGGGIKLARVILSVKSFKTMMIRMYHPKAILTLGINGKRMDTSAVLPIVSFVLLFFATAMLFGCILIFLGLDLASAISTSLSFLGGYGPGFGDVGVNGNYSTLNNSVKIILSVCMMVGRIELIPVYLLLSIRFWKK